MNCCPGTLANRSQTGRLHYNNVRPHSSLGNKTPAEARRALEQSEGNALGALAQPETYDY